MRRRSTGLLEVIPNDLLDHFADEISDRVDLRNLGLSCRAFGDVVFTRHLNYRVVELAIDDGVALAHLVQYPGRVANIRKLTLEAPQGEHLQQAQIDQTAQVMDSESRRLCADMSTRFERALQCMGRLTNLTLIQPSLWPKANSTEWTLPGLGVWNRLREQGTLKYLTVEMLVECQTDFDTYEKASTLSHKVSCDTKLFTFSLWISPCYV